MIYKYLAALGFHDSLRIQEESAYSDLSCMIRFYSEMPIPVEQLDRILLSGEFMVRKGKTQLHKWTERQVALCGTSLIVSSVKDCQAGKMHILPLVEGKIEEIKRRPQCLAFYSSGAQAQMYHVSFKSPADYQRWYRQASIVVSQRPGAVDLSCQSLEGVPEHLFYSQDITSLNLRHNFMNLQSSGGISTLCSLQTLNLDGNLLTSLPEELGSLQQLSTFGLAFSDLSSIPKVYEKLIALEKLCMAGNRLEALSLQILNNMPHLKHIDVRMNLITHITSSSLAGINHITYIDVRDNRLTALDLSCLGNLEQLHCERNRLQELSLCGFSLKSVFASFNSLTSVSVYPAPLQLNCLEIARNCLASVLKWVCEARKLEVLDLSWNLLTDLPLRLMSSLSLQKLLIGHNFLQCLPSPVEIIPLDTLDVQHNSLKHLPGSLFTMAINLRFLNASANSLEFLPPVCIEMDIVSQLQVLYITNNRLTDQCVPTLTMHMNLRVLHMAYNQLDTFPCSKLNKLENLEELDLSGNRLKSLPSTVSNCKRLHTLTAHSNCINVFPEIFNLPHIQLVDLSCNSLTEILVPENLPPVLRELDLQGNSDLVLSHQLLDFLRIDNKPVPKSDLSVPSVPWTHGLAEMSGQRNKLCVSSLAIADFTEEVDALYGMFDGDKNEEVPRLLQCTVGDVLLEEIQRSSCDKAFMCLTFLVSHGKLGMAGQKLGSSALLCYIGHEVSDGNSSYTLTNVGTCQAVLCRNGQTISLSQVFSLEHCPEELQRIKEQKAIITEDNKVNGVTCCTRLLGCTYLYPWVIPDPHISTVALSVQDEFLILGNRGLWEHVPPKEAVEAIRHLPNPRAAAKKLCTLALSYGCQDNVAALVIYLNIGEDSCTCDMHALALSSPSALTSSTTTKESPDSVTPSSSSGIASEFSSEISVSEVSSDVGSTASDEHTVASLDSGLLTRPERRCSLHPVSSNSTFQRQPSCATFSSNQSDNGLDSDDELQAETINCNGSKVEVDIHCNKQQSSEALAFGSSWEVEEECCGISVQILRQNSVNQQNIAGSSQDDMPLTSRSRMFMKQHSNSSVMLLEEILDLIEVASEAPKRKTGYFSAPSQIDPDPSQMENEMRVQLGDADSAIVNLRSYVHSPERNFACQLTAKQSQRQSPSLAKLPCACSAKYQNDVTLANFRQR
ncbi:hypothetical protein XELAEV_18024881mg [Xenopus laevis]|uniref:PPM-type phosphatase domain-containing protein n=1 Tax=Xenopus laevis TaxID=8355 RepID=A0A974HLM9_XENLA|nr:hypothetical protein XELAEV_18024881mg [Xenopus laevis]